ncbi:MAG: hypothetical protein HQL64_05345 [Magnetococcales bacterium]|nr:hypothetical protein [Magnetococcales bacterium]
MKIALIIPRSYSGPERSFHDDRFYLDSLFSRKLIFSLFVCVRLRYIQGSPAPCFAVAAARFRAVQPVCSRSRPGAGVHLNEIRHRQEEVGRGSSNSWSLWGVIDLFFKIIRKGSRILGEQVEALLFVVFMAKATFSILVDPDSATKIQA